MAKNSITDYSKTAASNTDIQSVDIAEGCLPSGINNAIRELMADLAEMNDGTVTLTSPAVGSVGVTGNITVGGTVDGRDVATDGTKLDGVEASADVTDTANVTAAGAAMLTGATFTGSITAPDATFNGNTAVTLPAGTDAQRPTGVNGMLRYNSDDAQFEGYADGAWGAIAGGGETSFLLYSYTATSGQTTFTGSDDNSATLSYTAANLMVTLNGIVLENGTDYTATNGTSIVLTVGASAGDELNVIAFKSFTVSDTVAASTGGTFSGNVAVNGDLTVDTDTLYVDSTNNRVGIGTSSPTANLHLSGSGARKIDITDTGGANTRISTANNNSYVGSTTNHPLLFITNDTERMNITAGGSLNIASPSSSTNIGRLDSSTYSSGERNLYIWAGNGTNYTQVSGRNAADGSPVFAAIVGGTTRAEIEANGDFLSATNSYGSTSDETLKENIVASGSQWDDIKAVQVKKFSYIADDLDAPNMLGVIAQDLEASGMNGLVKTKTKTRPTEDGDEEVVLDDDGNPVTYKTVKYSVLYMKAIKALQEAITKIEALETQNADFETRIAALEAE